MGEDHIVRQMPVMGVSKKQKMAHCCRYSVKRLFCVWIIVGVVVGILILFGESGYLNANLYEHSLDWYREHVHIKQQQYTDSHRLSHAFPVGPETNQEVRITAKEPPVIFQQKEDTNVNTNGIPGNGNNDVLRQTIQDQHGQQDNHAKIDNDVKSMQFVHGKHAQNAFGKQHVEKKQVDQNQDQNQDIVGNAALPEDSQGESVQQRPPLDLSGIKRFMEARAAAGITDPLEIDVGKLMSEGVLPPLRFDVGQSNLDQGKVGQPIDMAKLFAQHASVVENKLPQPKPKDLKFEVNKLASQPHMEHTDNPLNGGEKANSQLNNGHFITNHKKAKKILADLMKEAEERAAAGKGPLEIDYGKLVAQGVLPPMDVNKLLGKKAGAEPIVDLRQLLEGQKNKVAPGLPPGLSKTNDQQAVSVSPVGDNQNAKVETPLNIGDLVQMFKKAGANGQKNPMSVDLSRLLSASAKKGSNSKQIVNQVGNIFQNTESFKINLDDLLKKNGVVKGLKFDINKLLKNAKHIDWNLKVGSVEPLYQDTGTIQTTPLPQNIPPKIVPREVHQSVGYREIPHNPIGVKPLQPNNVHKQLVPQNSIQYDQKQNIAVQKASLKKGHIQAEYSKQTNKYSPTQTIVVGKRSDNFDHHVKFSQHKKQITPPRDDHRQMHHRMKFAKQMPFNVNRKQKAKQKYIYRHYNGIRAVNKRKQRRKYKRKINIDPLDGKGSNLIRKHETDGKNDAERHFQKFIKRHGDPLKYRGSKERHVPLETHKKVMSLIGKQKHDSKVAARNGYEQLLKKHIPLKKPMDAQKGTIFNTPIGPLKGKGGKDTKEIKKPGPPSRYRYEKLHKRHKKYINGKFHKYENFRMNSNKANKYRPGKITVPFKGKGLDSFDKRQKEGENDAEQHFQRFMKSQGNHLKHKVEKGSHVPAQNKVHRSMKKQNHNAEADAENHYQNFLKKHGKAKKYEDSQKEDHPSNAAKESEPLKGNVGGDTDHERMKQKYRKDKLHRKHKRRFKYKVEKESHVSAQNKVHGSIKKQNHDAEADAENHYQNFLRKHGSAQKYEDSQKENHPPNAAKESEPLKGNVGEDTEHEIMEQKYRKHKLHKKHKRHFKYKDGKLDEYEKPEYHNSKLDRIKKRKYRHGKLRNQRNKMKDGKFKIGKIITNKNIGNTRGKVHPEAKKMELNNKQRGEEYAEKHFQDFLNKHGPPKKNVDVSMNKNAANKQEKSLKTQTKEHNHGDTEGEAHFDDF